MNYLNAVFWDYPQFTNENYLKNIIQESKDDTLYLWILSRFLEYGRVVDTLNYFSIDEISKNITKLKLRPYTQKKWKRMIEVYGKTDRK